MKKDKDIDWRRVEELRRRGFYGSGATFSREEMKLLQQALRADKARYQEIGDALREEYRQQCCGG